MLGQLAAEAGARRAEYARRRKVFDEETFEKALRESREADGGPFSGRIKTASG